MPAGKTLVVFGSGPGIGVAVANVFAVRGFTHIALVSRDGARLAHDEDAVLDAIQERGYTCQTRIWPCDLSDLSAMKDTLAEVENFGGLECVLFNAARVAGRPPIEEGTEEIERDFRHIYLLIPASSNSRTYKAMLSDTPNHPPQLTNLALYETFKWALPLLQQRASEPSSSPSFFVTSTTQLYKEPLPDLVSLSMVKSAQRALVLSLHAKFGTEVHVALLSVGGVVSPDKKSLSPANIAQRCWELYRQPREGWQREEEVHDDE